MLEMMMMILIMVMAMMVMRMRMDDDDDDDDGDDHDYYDCLIDKCVYSIARFTSSMLIYKSKEPNRLQLYLDYYKFIYHHHHHHDDHHHHHLLTGEAPVSKHRAASDHPPINPPSEATSGALTII